ncbi:putative membrane protein [Lachnospiraceae bacterium KHCPX20]|nr:putative membrane protein [Lachnospiraceae bacterium KHCPX20]
MKLQELKKIFSKKYAIRVVAGALVITMAATGATQYTAYAERAAEKQETTEDLLDQANVKFSQKTIDKDETVYLISEADGTVTDTIVADHLYNRDGAKTLSDVSNLTDIENVNGEEKFTKDGDKMTWNADGKDIYYQGHSDAKAPVEQKVTYMLDGKEIAPKDLAGKSGHVTIHYDYTNNSTFTEKVNGEDVSVVVPFAAITGMVLNDDFKNVKVSNGRIVQNGTKTVAVGYTLPGFKDSLQSGGGRFDKDIDIPESFEVSADVTDFQLETAMTVVVNAGNLMTASTNNVNSLSGDMNRLQSSSKKLVDGSGKLADGLSTLQSSLTTFQSGAKALAGGVKDYTNGVSKLDAGISTMKKSVSPLEKQLPTLSKKLKTLSDGVGKLKDGSDKLLAGYEGDGTAENPGLTKSMDALSKGAKQLSDGASALDAGIGQLTGALSGVGESFGKASAGQITSTIDAKLNTNKDLMTLLVGCGVLKAGDKITLENIDTVVATLEGGQKQIITALATNYVKAGQDQGTATVTATGAYFKALDGLHQVQAAKNALNAAGKQLSDQLSATAGSKETQSQIAKLAAGSKQLAQGSKQLSDGLAKADQGVKKLASGQKQLSGGIDQLYNGINGSADTKGISSLAGGLAKLVAGINKLDEGSNKIVANNQKLTNGANKLYDGSGKIVAGVDKLAAGSKTLADGMVQFNEEGIETLVNAYNGDIKPLANRLRAAIDAGEDYESFSGIEKNMNGDVKFIYRMAAITTEE